MAEQNLTGLKIKDTYEGLLHVSDGGISGNSGEAAVTKVYDGVGKSTCLEIAKDYLKVIGDSKFENALGDPLLTINSIGNVGIGGGAGAQLAIKGNGTTTWGGIAVTSSDDGDWGFIDQGVEGKGIGLRGFGFQDGTRECDLYVVSSGEVGIGTEAPAKKLHIVGQMRYEHGTPAVGQVLTCTNTSGDVEWQGSSSGEVTKVPVLDNTFKTYARGQGTSSFATIRMPGAYVSHSGDAAAFRGSGDKFFYDITNTINTGTAYNDIHGVYILISFSQYVNTGGGFGGFTAWTDLYSADSMMLKQEVKYHVYDRSSGAANSPILRTFIPLDKPVKAGESQRIHIVAEHFSGDRGSYSVDRALLECTITDLLVS
jgi:hypothetical protein